MNQNRHAKNQPKYSCGKKTANTDRLQISNGKRTKKKSSNAALLKKSAKY